MCHFCSLKILKKVEKIQERTLRKPYNDSTSDYNQLLNKSSKVSMEVKRLRKLALEKLKTVNNLSPEYMKEIFYKTTNLTHRTFNIKVNQNNTTKYVNKSVRSLGPHIWNSLPKQIKEETNYNKFKNYIHKWFGAKCKCNFFLFKLKIWIDIQHDVGFDPFNLETVLFFILYFIS